MDISSHRAHNKNTYSEIPGYMNLFHIKPSRDRKQKQIVGGVEMMNAYALIQLYCATGGVHISASDMDSIHHLDMYATKLLTAGVV
eukprot:118774-Pleurochrysis_carterae.AAC.2